PLFLGLVVLLLSSCDLFGSNTPTIPAKPVKAPAKDQVFVAPVLGASDITTFDPALAYDTSSISAIQMIYTGLVQLDDKYQIHPQLAQTWQQSSDGLTWTFHLKPNLKFSDGTPLTSADVIYSIDRALQPTTKSTVAPIYLDLIRDSDKLLGGRIQSLINDSLLAPDQNTVVIQTKKSAAYFLSMLAQTCSYVVEKHLIDTYGSNFTDHLNLGGGDGPFKVKQYIHGKEIDFVPNPNYYNALPQLQRVVFPFYPQAEAAYQAYQNGQVDLTGVPIANFDNDKKRSDFHQVPQLWINYYTMNYLVKPFDNINMREAFALAIDKTAIASSVWQGTVIPTNHIVPQSMPGYDPALTGPDGTPSLNGNPGKARALLQQGLHDEGWSSIAQVPPIKLTYATGVSNFDQEVKAMIGMWQSVLGITVKANPVDYNSLLDEVTAATNNPQGISFWGLAWVAEYPDPQDWLTRQFDKGVPNNSMNYGQNFSNDASQQQSVQTQLERADSIFQPDARIQTYWRAEQQLVNDVVWIPMEQVTNVYLLKPYVIGFAENQQGLIPPDNWANIFIVQH
ncbi:MAG TPA: peptide ABC transporter substrate-binding protein, partial [Ktedonobacteraceae bacterium]|nr:peptide ABC transporter substrate-binding protein [Ktedonobacteraceae bacterium]